MAEHFVLGRPPSSQHAKWGKVPRDVGVIE
jgi:hypothetical protein